MRLKDAVDFSNRVKKGPSPGVALAEVVEAHGRKGASQNAYADKETSATAIAATEDKEDGVDYPKRIKKDP